MSEEKDYQIAPDAAAVIFNADGTLVSLLPKEALTNDDAEVPDHVLLAGALMWALNKPEVVNRLVDDFIAATQLV